MLLLFLRLMLLFFTVTADCLYWHSHEGCRDVIAGNCFSKAFGTGDNSL